MFLRCMGNVLDDEKQQRICALGRLGWTLSRIQATTGIRRETVSGYLKAAGIPVRGRGRPSEAAATAAIPGEVSTDPSAKPAIIPAAVSTDPARAPSASACEPYRELIVEAIGRGRNAVAIWQDLVDDHGFAGRYASVRRSLPRTPSARPQRFCDWRNVSRRDRRDAWNRRVVALARLAAGGNGNRGPSRASTNPLRLVGPVGVRDNYAARRS